MAKKLRRRRSFVDQLRTRGVERDEVGFQSQLTPAVRAALDNPQKTAATVLASLLVPEEEERQLAHPDEPMKVDVGKMPVGSAIEFVSQVMARCLERVRYIASHSNEEVKAAGLGGCASALTLLNRYSDWLATAMERHRGKTAVDRKTRTQLEMIENFPKGMWREVVQLYASLPVQTPEQAGEFFMTMHDHIGPLEKEMPTNGPVDYVHLLNDFGSIFQQVGIEIMSTRFHQQYPHKPEDMNRLAFNYRAEIMARYRHRRFAQYVTRTTWYGSLQRAVAEHPYMLNGFEHFFQKFFQQLEGKTPDVRKMENLEDSYLNPSSRYHAQVTRAVEAMLYGSAGSRAIYPFLVRVISNHFSDIQSSLKSERGLAIKRLLATVLKPIERVLTQHDMVELQLRLSGILSTIVEHQERFGMYSPDEVFLRTAEQPLPDFPNRTGLCEIVAEQGVPTVSVSVEASQSDLERNVFRFPELSPERRKQLHMYREQLLRDIRHHAALGLLSRVVRVGNGLMSVTPNDGPMPSGQYGFVTDKLMYTGDMDGEAEVQHPRRLTEGQFRQTDTDDILETAFIALAHDLTVRKLTVVQKGESATGGGDAQQAPPTQRDESSGRRGAPSDEAQRVHVLEQYVVIEPEQEELQAGGGVRVVETRTGNDSELQVLRFVRPHWVELSPDVVRMARVKALDTVLPRSSLTEDQQALFRKAVSSESAHLTQMDEYITRLFASSFANDLERYDFIASMEEAERSEYTRLLHRYTGQDVIDAAVRNGTLKNMNDGQYEGLMKSAERTGRERAREDGVRFGLPDAQGISERRKEEQREHREAKEAAALEGRVYQESFQVPPPRRSVTQTYRRSHVREVSQVKLNGGVGKTAEGAVIVRASSAVDAVFRLAGVTIEK